MTQPTDGKNQEVTSKLRYVISSGDMDAIHGMSNYQVMTQEAQVLGFYADTGQGKGGQGGPGTGKHVLNTPGLSMEVLGRGLKVRDNGDITQLPAKIIKCKRGDVIIDCENGDITLKARNINIQANGAGNKDGQLLIDGARLVDVRGPDVKIQGEKFTCRATQECDIVTDGFMKMKSAFKIDAQKADEAFGTMSSVLEKATSLNIPKVGEKLKSIEDKVKNIDTEAIGETFGEVAGDISNVLEEQDIGAATQNIQDALSGLLGGLG
jgi:hypothetical protein